MHVGVSNADSSEGMFTAQGAFQENMSHPHVTEHVICCHNMCQTQTQRNRERGPGVSKIDEE